MSQELSDKIRAAAQAKGIDPGVALRIAGAESTYNPKAQSKSSSAGGLFQVVDKTWKDFGGAPGKKYDADENIRVGTDIIAKNTQTLKGFLNRDPRPAEVYAAHYFGPTGARSVLAADPNTPAIDILGAKVIRDNPNLKGKTAGEVMAQLEKKMGGTPAVAPVVSRETTPEQTPAEKIMEPALRSGMTAQAPAPTPAPESRMASLGPSYQAALALSFLADTDDKEDRDVDREPGIAEKWLAEQPAKSTTLAGFSDISIKSPFAEPAQPQMLAKGGPVMRAGGSPETGEVQEPSLPRVSNYATMVAQDMYPGQQGQFDQQDAARHMLAAGTLSRKYGPRAAEMLGNLHEIGTSPFRWAGSKLGISEMPVDYEQDLYNNQLGIGLAKRSKSQKDLEDLVQQMAEQHSGQRTEGRPWTGRPVKRTDGSPITGEQAPTAEEIAIASRPGPAMNPMIQRQGEAARRLAAMRDVNTLPDPKTYAAVSGFLGTPPDEQGFSVLHPDIAGIKKAGGAGFTAGTVAQVAPMVGPAVKMVGKLAGSALNERLLAGKSPIPGLGMPSPLLFAAKPRGGVSAYTGQTPKISKLDDLIESYSDAAQRSRATDEVQEFLKTKAPKYFASNFGTADDPLRTAFRERRIEPFGRDQSKLKPYLIDTASQPEARGYSEAKIDLERLYDEMAGVRPTALRAEGATTSESGIREMLSRKMGEEGVPVEARNVPSVDVFSQEDFAKYPSSSRMLSKFVESQETLPSSIQHALRTGEPIFDVNPNMHILSPANVVEALQEIPANKLKNMSFPEALIQGTQTLAPVRDYRTAIDLADRGARVPRKALDLFTRPVTAAPSVNGQWVQLTKPVATELEGKLMKHSIGGYGAGESYGTAYTQLPYGGKKAFDEDLVRVYSLRDAQGLPEVSVEVARSNAGKGDTWNVSQIRGKFNSEPAFQAREDIFNLLNNIDSKDGLGAVKSNSYSRSSTGESVEGTMVDWGREYDLWKQGAE